MFTSSASLSETRHTPVSLLRHLLVQLLRGLDYLHDRGWVHFDLSLDSVAVRILTQSTRSLSRTLLVRDKEVNIGT